MQDVPADEVLNLSLAEAKIAFTVEGYWSYEREAKNDPRYTKWLFRLFTIEGGETKSKELGLHRCNEKDYAQFFPIEPTQEKLLESIKADPKRGLFCMDDEEEAKYELFGNDQLENYQRVELVVMPCNSINTDAGLIEGAKG